MTMEKHSQVPSGWVRTFVDSLFRRTPFALRWVLAPAVVGLGVTIAVCSVLYVANALGLAAVRIGVFAIGMTVIFGSVCVGGLFGGILFQILPLNYSTRLVVGWAVSGVSAGITMGTLLILVTANPKVDYLFISMLLAAGGLVLGIVLGLGFAHASRRDDDESTS